MKSIINLADSYKYSHSSQYPPNMVANYSYMESRGGKYSATVFVGLQYYLQKYLTTPVTLAEVERTRLKAERHGVPFDYDGWLHIINNCNGLLPIRIKAIPEGSLVPTRNVLLTIESTDSTVPWITGFVETLLMKIWYPTTIATKSHHVRQMLERYGSSEWAQFALHNFGDRGSSSVESAAIGGFAHYTQFMGTDNFNSLDIAESFYKHTDMPAYAVFATEHSTTTSYGREGEEAFVYAQLLANPDKAIMSFVADSYDVYAFTHFCTDPDSRIRKLIESRPRQKFVLRPDSGEPIMVLSNMIGIMKVNGVFDATIGDKVLSTNFGLLWGDGITSEVIEDILKTFTTYEGFAPSEQTSITLLAAENFVFGSGGDIMQNVNRDTQRFAIKCSSITTRAINPFNKHGDTPYNYNDIDVYKDPVTAPDKRSKRGKVTTWFNTETREYSTGLVGQQPSPHHINALQTVFENGKILISPSLEGIRKRST